MLSLFSSLFKAISLARSYKLVKVFLLLFLIGVVLETEVSISARLKADFFSFSFSGEKEKLSLSAIVRTGSANRADSNFSLETGDLDFLFIIVE